MEIAIGNTGWVLSWLVDDDGHLNLYITNTDGSPIHEIETGQGDGEAGGQLALRFTTEQIESMDLFCEFCESNGCGDCTKTPDMDKPSHYKPNEDIADRRFPELTDEEIKNNFPMKSGEGDINKHPIKAHTQLSELWAIVKKEGDCTEYVDEMIVQLLMLATETNTLTKDMVFGKLEGLLADLERVKK